MASRILHSIFKFVQRRPHLPENARRFQVRLSALLGRIVRPEKTLAIKVNQM